MSFGSGSVSKRVAALITAGVMALGAVAPAAALAADNAPGQVGSGTNGTGETHLKMITKANKDDEYSETGANIKFTFPSVINYVVDAEGTLTGPSASAAYLKNGSMFPIHVSSVKTTEKNGWDFVADYTATGNANNSVELNVGPTADAAINLKDYETKKNLDSNKAASWSMAVDGQVGLATHGSAIAKVTQDISSTTEFGTIQWFVKSGA
jgi:hypothetical protein